MNVIINGLAMPKHCWQCRFKDSEDLCILLDDDCMKIWGEETRLPNCPLIELPDHGDLIERDDAISELSERLRANRYANAALVSELTRSIGYLMQLQAVIPAERSEYECTD